MEIEMGRERIGKERVRRCETQKGRKRESTEGERKRGGEEGEGERERVKEGVNLL